ncbi:mediator of RNA polymerase II transcription subunit 8 [Orbilia ellipsospora]|uniref:Mediator of RNA polymerase II transcription subunit 8 n=1 Tax=Orbilia ellipsospora TaxID=2528407 RepID=A0AAV9XKV1_9PEZI
MSTSTSGVPIEALERLRTQLGLLTQSIGSLLQDLRTADPLPPWPTLTAQLAILNSQLSTLSRSLHQHSNTLSSTVAFPLPTFPVRTQEGLLNLLLRKKLAPEVEEWLAAGRDKGLALKSAGGTGPDGKPSGTASDSEDGGDSDDDNDDDDDSDDDMQDDDNADGEGKKRNRHWALKAVIKDQRSRDWDADFTKEELESVQGDISNIQTGLMTDGEGRIVKRSIDPASSFKRPENGWTLEMVFRFMSTGMRPEEYPVR